jgi:hypothetical protein
LIAVEEDRGGGVAERCTGSTGTVVRILAAMSDAQLLLRTLSLSLRAGLAYAAVFLAAFQWFAFHVLTWFYYRSTSGKVSTERQEIPRAFKKATPVSVRWRPKEAESDTSQNVSQ